MTENKKQEFKSIKITQEAFSMLSIMSKATNSFKSGFLSELVKEVFNTFTVFVPCGVNIYYESSIYPETCLKILFSGRRVLSVGKSSDRVINETLLKVKGEKEVENDEA